MHMFPLVKFVPLKTSNFQYKEQKKNELNPKPLDATSLLEDYFTRSTILMHKLYNHQIMAK